MSAISQGAKFKLGGFFKSLFQKSPRTSATAQVAETESEPISYLSPPLTNTSSSEANDTGNGVAHGVGKSTDTGLELPLQPILAGFPLELRPKIRQPQTGSLTVTIPFDRILAQLPSGLVKLPFGNIRRAHPNLFAPGTEADNLAVSVPLNEILSRLNPALLARRPVQKRIEVPADIESPFAGKGEGLSFAVGNTQPETSASPAPAAPRAQPAFPAAVTPAIPPATPAIQPAAPAVQPAAASSQSTGTTTFRRISPKSMLPAHPVTSGADLKVPIAHHKATPASPAVPATPPPTSAPIPMPNLDHAAVFQRKPATPAAHSSPTTPIAPATPGKLPAANEPALFQRKPTLPSAPSLPITPIAPATPALKLAEGGPNVFQKKPALSVPSAPSMPAKSATPAANAKLNDAALFQRKPTQPAASATPIAPAEPVVAKTAPTVDEAALFQKKPAAPTTDIAPAANLTPNVTPEVPPASAFAPAAPPRPKDYFANPPIQRSVQPAPPTPPSPASSAAPVETIAISLSALAEAWPDSIRQEIVQSNLVEARLAMPADLVEASLKRGRVAFPWRTVRGWIRPPSAASASSSPQDAIELELPLKVIAPMFLTRQKAAAKQQRPEIDETIPNLFFGLPRPEPAASPRPADTNYYVWGDATDSARVDDTDFKRKAGGTDFMSRYATPNEIVSRAAALDGIAGVLIALPDGLMVANQIPPDCNGDALAAFLPQIFSKVTQCTKELRLGELNNLNFTVGNVPWKIFRVNAIFFAAFGRAGEPLPSAELAGLAAELDRKRTV